jgi:hypothetical protein
MPMTPKDFTICMGLLTTMRSDAAKTLERADRLENSLLLAAGITHTNREPGFPCWSIASRPGQYFNTPEEAIQAQEATHAPR